MNESWQCVSVRWMKMIVIKSTFQDEKVWDDIRGLGLAYCRTPWTGAGALF